MRIDFSTSTWIQVVTWAHDQLERARKKNDAPIGPEETALLRGEIRTLKRLLALPEEAARDEVPERVETPFGGGGF